MNYFVVWSYQNKGLYSHIYKFKYHLNDKKDYMYLKAEIASCHSPAGSDEPIDMNDVGIINLFVLDDIPATMTEEKYTYSISYYLKYDEQENEFHEDLFTFNTEIKTKDNVKDIFKRICEEHSVQKNQVTILNWILIEVKNTIEEDA
jgi:hypothetical protein